MGWKVRYLIQMLFLGSQLLEYYNFRNLEFSVFIRILPIMNLKEQIEAINELIHLIDTSEPMKEVKLKKYRISYFYLASGMEGIADEYPEKVIEAPTKPLAVYIYYLMFFAETDLNKMSNRGKGNDFCNISFEDFMRKEDHDDYWGITIEEV